MIPHISSGFSFPASSSKLNASAGAHSGDHEGVAHNVTEYLVSQQQIADCSPEVMEIVLHSLIQTQTV